MSDPNPAKHFDTDTWENIVPSVIVSISIGWVGLGILYHGTKIPRQKRSVNVFNQLFLALFTSGMLVRSFYWITWVSRGTPGDKDDQGISVSSRAFLITYPQLNILICTFLIQYPWLYDFIILQNGREITLVLRQQMKMFVVAANIFIVLMYIVYAFAFPITDDSLGGKLISLYNTMMVFDLISAILITCQIISGARRIEGVNAEYGRVVKIQGIILLQSNVVSAVLYYFLAQGQFKFIDLHVVWAILVEVLVYGLTELLPLLSFVYAQNKLVEAMNPPPAADDENEEGNENNEDQNPDGRDLHEDEDPAAIAEQALQQALM